MAKKENKAVKNKAKYQELLKFLNKYYITTRYKFVVYQAGKEPYTIDTKHNTNKQKYIEGLKSGSMLAKRNSTEEETKEWIKEEEPKMLRARKWSLNDVDIMEHLAGDKTIGIYFPQGKTKLIGLDLDFLDEMILEELYYKLIHYGIQAESMLITFSGSKGFHLDIFLEDFIDAGVVVKFYNILKEDLKSAFPFDFEEEKFELRGASGQAYKLPLGIHQKTKNKCSVVNEYGREIKNYIKVIRNIVPVSTEVINDVVEMNYESLDIDNKDMDTFLKMDTKIKNSERILNVEFRIEKCEKLIDTGVYKIGTRHNSLFEVSLYYKYLGYDRQEVKKLIRNWISEKWDTKILYTALNNDIESTVGTIFDKNYVFDLEERHAYITKSDILEVLSLKEAALRKLYYLIMLHSKIYANKKNGVFYMTYMQMSEAGAIKNNNQKLKMHIEKLIEYGKIAIVGRQEKNKPTKYKLLLADVESENDSIRFEYCKGEKKCEDCFNKALCHLFSLIEITEVMGNKKAALGIKRGRKCDFNR